MHPEQLRLAEALDEAFDVTFGNQHGGQFVWLLEPKVHVAERFGLQKEIVSLYSPHARTDARTLTNLENISNAPEFKHRIDKVVAIIVHEGDGEVTAELTKETPDWVIVPIRGEELRQKRGAFFLRARLAERIGEFDLFGMSSPIRDDKYFYGRDSLVQEILQRVMVRGENSGVFGLRKTGKTSVLFAIQRRLAEKDVIVEYIDCQSPGIYGSRWWQLLAEVSRRLVLQYTTITGMPIDDDGIYDSGRASNSFNRLIKKMISAGGLGGESLSSF